MCKIPVRYVSCGSSVALHKSTHDARIIYIWLVNPKKIINVHLMWYMWAVILCRIRYTRTPDIVYVCWWSYPSCQGGRG